VHSLWSNKEFLLACEELFKAGVHFPFRAGARVARGFADLGHEEFVLLTRERLLSLYNGKGSTLEPEHESFFMVVPNLDELIDALQRLAVDIHIIEFKEQRSWALHLKRETEPCQCFEHADLLCALAQGLLHYTAHDLNFRICPP
jgi:hypothetical protein